MDEERVVRIRMPTEPRSDDFRYGSGYVIGPGLVLTAEHVLRVAGYATDPPPSVRCEVLPVGADPHKGWLAGRVSERDEALDLAIVAVAGLAPGVGPVRWGKLGVGVAPLGWTAVGFP